MNGKIWQEKETIQIIFVCKIFVKVRAIILCGNKECLLQSTWATNSAFEESERSVGSSYNNNNTEKEAYLCIDRVYLPTL